MTTSSLQNRINRLYFFVSAVILLSANIAAAQSDPVQALSYNGPNYQPTSPNPVEMGFTQHHSSTALEGARRGKAAVIQAWGNWELDESQSEILREHARALGRENDLKQTQALHVQIGMWNQARIQARDEHEARLAEGQRKVAERSATVYHQTYQLSPMEFDAATGAINWPTVLQDTKYQQVRERVEELFRLQRGYGNPQPGTAKEITRNIESMRRALRNDVSSMPNEDFAAAAKFLVGLKLEAESLPTSA